AGAERGGAEVDRDRRERHRERLEELQQVVAALEIPEAERQAGEGRVDEADELRRPAEDPERAARPEAAAELAVDNLVRVDPRRRDVAPAPEAEQRRDADEEPDEDRRTSRPAHRRIMPRPRAPPPNTIRRTCGSAFR